MPTNRWKSVLNANVLISGLGYFVDLFDITLFGVTRVASLQDLGIRDTQELLSSGLTIYNAGMVGMMLGGVLWGILSDKLGRTNVLFGSILIYSLGNIANAFVWDTTSYACIRFIIGIGLAGELGAAVTLVAESLPQNLRGVGTTIVATLGLTGSIAAAFVGQILPWKWAYICGGVLGLLLLFARLQLRESGLFQKMSLAPISRGTLRILLRPQLAFKYLACILVGAPIYFISGILFTFSPEITTGLGIAGVSAGNALLYGSIGLALGDLLSGLLSQFLQSRRQAIALCLTLAVLLITIYLLYPAGMEARHIYWLCFGAGCAAGYWAVLVTSAAEQFGTNIRGTVATSIPNFVRGSAVLTTLAFSYLKNFLPIPVAASLVGLIIFILAFTSLYFLRETFHQDLDYYEQ